MCSKREFPFFLEDKLRVYFRGSIIRGAKSIAMAMHEGLPLVGIQVVDFGQYIAGPLTARLLADAGATVTKIDPQDSAPQLSARACAFACALPQLRLRRHARRGRSFAATSTRSTLEEQRKFMCIYVCMYGYLDLTSASSSASRISGAIRMGAAALRTHSRA